MEQGAARPGGMRYAVTSCEFHGVYMEQGAQGMSSVVQLVVFVELSTIPGQAAI